MAQFDGKHGELKHLFSIHFFSFSKEGKQWMSVPPSALNSREENGCGILNVGRRREKSIINFPEWETKEGGRVFSNLRPEIRGGTPLSPLSYSTLRGVINFKFISPLLFAKSMCGHKGGWGRPGHGGDSVFISEVTILVILKSLVKAKLLTLFFPCHFIWGEGLFDREKKISTADETVGNLRNLDLELFFHNWVDQHCLCYPPAMESLFYKLKKLFCNTFPDYSELNGKSRFLLEIALQSTPARPPEQGMEKSAAAAETGFYWGEKHEEIQGREGKKAGKKPNSFFGRWKRFRFPRRKELYYEAAAKLCDDSELHWKREGMFFPGLRFFLANWTRKGQCLDNVASSFDCVPEKFYPWVQGCDKLNCNARISLTDNQIPQLRKNMFCYRGHCQVRPRKKNLTWANPLERICQNKVVELQGGKIPHTIESIPNELRSTRGFNIFS